MTGLRVELEQLEQFDLGARPARLWDRALCRAAQEHAAHGAPEALAFALEWMESVLRSAIVQNEPVSMEASAAMLRLVLAAQGRGLGS